MNEYVHQIQRIARLRPHGSVAQRATIFTRHDTQCVVHEVLRLAQQDPERAFTMAMHTVVSQLSGEVTQSGHTSLSPPVIDGLFAGMLHRQTMHSMVCSPSVTAVCDGSVWKLSADALLAVNPAMVQRWYVLAHTEDGSIDAFWFNTGTDGMRKQPQTADARITPLNAHVFSLDQVRVPEAARIPLGKVRAPAPILQQVARVYRAMACALCCGIGYATRSVASLYIKTPTQRPTHPARRQRAPEHLSRIDALLLTSEVSLRGIASNLLEGGACAPPLCSVQHLHRLSLDSSIAAILLAARSMPSVSNMDHATLHRHRRDAVAISALAANFDLVQVATA